MTIFSTTPPDDGAVGLGDAADCEQVQHRGTLARERPSETFRAFETRAKAHVACVHREKPLGIELLGEGGGEGRAIHMQARDADVAGTYTRGAHITMVFVCRRSTSETSVREEAVLGDVAVMGGSAPTLPISVWRERDEGEGGGAQRACKELCRVVLFAVELHMLCAMRGWILLRVPRPPPPLQAGRTRVGF